MSQQAQTPGGDAEETVVIGDSVGATDVPVVTSSRYAVLEKIGAGGMGRVYRAYDAKLSREVALKVLSSAVGPDGRARTLREAQALAQLNHPNVVAVYDVDEDGGRPFISMEYVPGPTLREWIKAEPRTWRVVLDTFISAGVGLAAAHRAGIVHRDFKMSNVLISEDGRAHVTDFGLARGAESRERSSGEHSGSSDSDMIDAQLTVDGTVLGTPAYMAPEQHTGAAADARSDQYAFCVSLYDALVGRLPFRGEDVDALARAKKQADFQWPSTLPRWIGAVLRRGLSPHPADRFESMDGVLAALAADPARRRRKYLVAAGVVLVAAAAVIAERTQAQRAVDACETHGRSIDAVWGEHSRGRVGEALGATAARVVPWLDDYAEAWQSARIDVCRASTIDGRRSAELRRLSGDCLAERRAHLQALVDLLSEGGAEVEHRAVQSAASLPGIPACVDDGWLLQRAPPPDDDKTQAVVAEVRAELAKSRALLDIGQHEKAADVTAAVQQRAANIDWDPLRAEVLSTLGRVANVRGDYETASARLEEAFLVAGASGHDTLAVSAATQLTHVVGSRLAHHRQGLRWGSIARMMLARLGAAGTLREAALLRHVADILLLQGEGDSALEEMSRALSIVETTLGPKHPTIAAYLRGVGTIAQHQGDYDRALELQRRALRIVQATKGSEHPEVALTLTALASVWSKKGDHARAIDHLARALGTLEGVFGPHHPRVAAALAGLGSAYNTVGAHEQAEAAHRRALAIKERTLGSEHPDVATTLNSLGNFYFARKSYDDALAAHARALAIWTKSYGPDHPDLGYSYNNIGNARLAKEEFAEARAAYEHALALWETGLGRDHANLAFPLHGLGNVFVQSGRPELAVHPLERAISVREGAKMSGLRLAETRFLLARALWSVGTEQERARTLAEHARSDYAQGGHEPEAKKVQDWLDARSP